MGKKRAPRKRDIKESGLVVQSAWMVGPGHVHGANSGIGSSKRFPITKKTGSQIPRASRAMTAEMMTVGEWAVGFFFGNTELSMELWTVIAGISGLDDY